MRFLIPVEPKGKQRARTVSRNGRVFSYTPGQTVQTEALIRSYVCQNKLYFDKTVPIYLKVVFTLARPKSCPKKRTVPTTRPDIDNLLKLVLDACNRFLWADDAQIVKLEASKVYGNKPQIEIETIRL